MSKKSSPHPVSEAPTEVHLPARGQMNHVEDSNLSWDILFHSAHDPAHTP